MPLRCARYAIGTYLLVLGLSGCDSAREEIRIGSNAPVATFWRTRSHYGPVEYRRGITIEIGDKVVRFDLPYDAGTGGDLTVYRIGSGKGDFMLLKDELGEYLFDQRMGQAWSVRRDDNGEYARAYKGEFPQIPITAAYGDVVALNKVLGRYTVEHQGTIGGSAGSLRFDQSID